MPDLFGPSASFGSEWTGGARPAPCAAEIIWTAALRVPTMSSMLAGAGFQIPVQNLFAGPVHDTLEASCVLVDRFEIFDAVRLSADVGVNGEREDFRALFPLGVEAVGLIDCAAGRIVAF